jgi:hypothetical protein
MVSNMIFFDSIKIKEASALGVPKEFEVSGGLTKREFLAGLAMQGFLAGPGKRPRQTAEVLAMYSIEAADALIKRLEIPSENL